MAGNKRSRLVLWMVLAGLGGLSFAFVLHAFQAGMLGVLSGTTTDPRTALGERPRSASMEPRLFVLSDTVFTRNHKADRGIETPEIRLAIPAAYLNVVRTEKDGWFGTNMLDVGISVSSETFKPYRTEYPRVRREVLEKLGIQLVQREPTLLTPNPDPKDLIFPDAEAKARYDVEMRRRGFTEILSGISVGPAVTIEERRKDLLSLPFIRYRAHPPFVGEGCVASPGPYPGSVRYDHSPEALENEQVGSLTVSGSCIRHVHKRKSFAVVQYDEDGEIVMTMICREQDDKKCHANFIWADAWTIGIVVSSEYITSIPNYKNSIQDLYSSFHTERQS